MLRMLESKPDLSQRALALELGVSLGKAHYCLRALIEKGYVKAANFKNNSAKHRCIYCLTPKGLAAKTRITKRFLHRKLIEHETLIQEIKALQEEIQQQEVDRKSQRAS